MNTGLNSWLTSIHYSDLLFTVHQSSDGLDRSALDTVPFSQIYLNLKTVSCSEQQHHPSSTAYTYAQESPLLPFLQAAAKSNWDRRRARQTSEPTSAVSYAPYLQP